MHSLSVLQLSDCHILSETNGTLLGVDTRYYFTTVLQQALADYPKIDLLILTGDLAQEPSIASYGYLRDTLTPLGIPCLCLSGNHDDATLMQSVLNTALIRCDKQRILGNWQFINLNSQIIGEDGGYLAASELALLRDGLQHYPNHHALIAVHHHCVPTGSAWLDTMIIHNSAEFLALLDIYPHAKAVIHGHIHQASDGFYGAVRILGTPSTCFQFKPHSPSFSLDERSPAYRYLKLHADGRIDTQVTHISQLLTHLQRNNTSGY